MLGIGRLVFSLKFVTKLNPYSIVVVDIAAFQYFAGRVVDQTGIVKLAFLVRVSELADSVIV